jgi:hypothetical protein
MMENIDLSNLLFNKKNNNYPVEFHQATSIRPLNIIDLHFRLSRKLRNKKINKKNDLIGKPSRK